MSLTALDKALKKMRPNIKPADRKIWEDLLVNDAAFDQKILSAKMGPRPGELDEPLLQSAYAAVLELEHNILDSMPVAVVQMTASASIADFYSTGMGTHNLSEQIFSQLIGTTAKFAKDIFILSLSASDLIRDNVPEENLEEALTAVNYLIQKAVKEGSIQGFVSAAFPGGQKKKNKLDKGDESEKNKTIQNLEEFTKDSGDISLS